MTEDCPTASYQDQTEGGEGEKRGRGGGGGWHRMAHRASPIARGHIRLPHDRPRECVGGSHACEDYAGRESKRRTRNSCVRCSTRPKRMSIQTPKPRPGVSALTCVKANKA